jgi:hypothetical protein
MTLCGLRSVSSWALIRVEWRTTNLFWEPIKSWTTTTTIFWSLMRQLVQTFKAQYLKQHILCISLPTRNKDDSPSRLTSQLRMSSYSPKKKNYCHFKYSQENFWMYPRTMYQENLQSMKRELASRSVGNDLVILFGPRSRPRTSSYWMNVTKINRMMEFFHG